MYYSKLTFSSTTGRFLSEELMRQPIVSIAFNECTQDIIASALPPLLHYETYATLYVVSSYIEQRPGYIDAENLRIIEDLGMEIGSMTRRNPNLLRLSGDEAWQEISIGKRDLERERIYTSTFAYPGGLYDKEEHPTMVRAANFKCAVTLESGHNDLNTLPYELCCVPVKEEADFEEIRAMITDMRGLLWTIFIFDHAGPILEQTLKHLRESKIRTLTVDDAFDKVRKEAKKITRRS
jgi:peptidoglycan/xylan/chitin deacetylase (PgdA/CDA1 family)